MFRLYDSVILNESLKISEEMTALPGTPGTIVEILGNGEAYIPLLETFRFIGGQSADRDLQGISGALCPPCEIRIN